MEKKARPKIPLSSANPFADSQARNYSGKKALTEFCPVSKYWSLFNDQHELLVGTRGCGKTLLLKMMRYSMLNKLSNAKAKKLVNDKNFIAFYVPLHLEYIKKLSNDTLSKDAKIAWFRFSFNCLLAQSVIIEITEILSDLIDDDLKRVEIEYNLSRLINDSWGISTVEPVFHLSKLREKVDKLYYSTDPEKDELTAVPNTFTHSLASSLSSISNILCDTLQISPTWIVCVDEAEFAEECYQECINTAFRAYTGRIAFKVATLHFYHKTRATLIPNISVMDGQDFKCTIVDMKFDEQDFISVTDSLVKTRLASVDIELNGLEDFLETLGSDNYIDYFSKEMKYDKFPRELLETQIIAQLSSNSRNHNIVKSQQERKKPVIDKLAPIFYVREMYKRAKEGARIPGWYAGASMARRISQGNPRLFIRMMNNIFDVAKGRKLPLTVKAQHKSLMDFAISFCKETQTLEKVGPEARKQLDYVSAELQRQTHKVELTQVGTTFILNRNIDLLKQQAWIEKAVAFSRLIIDEDTLKTQIDNETIYHLANSYAAAYWLPMRTHSSPRAISFPDDVSSAYLVRKPKKKGDLQKNGSQLSLLSQGGNCDANQK